MKRKKGSIITAWIKDRRGITLTEILAASAAFFILLGALLGFSVFATKTMAASTTRSDVQAKARQMMTYAAKAVHPSYTINILSAKPASFTSGRQYLYVEDGYLKHYSGAHTTTINNAPLQNLTVAFSRGVSTKVIIVNISYNGLSSAYSEQVLAENAGTSAGTGTTGTCLEFKITP